MTQAEDVNLENGDITFSNATRVRHDVVIGADGIGSAVRGVLGIKAERRPATCTCLHANVDTARAVELGLVDYSQNSAIEYWGGLSHSLQDRAVSLQRWPASVILLFLPSRGGGL